VWRQLDSKLWEITHNPWVVLQTVSRDQIEREVIPEFYTRDDSGIPTAWVKRMRESMARLTPRFCVNRTVREYTEQRYLPAASAYRERAADKGAVGLRMVKWRHTLEEKWATLHFGEVRVATDAERHIFKVEVYLNDLDPNAVRVELYADGVNCGAPVRQEMKRGHNWRAQSDVTSTARRCRRPARRRTIRRA
jgi:Glucan phosphorylase